MNEWGWTYPTFAAQSQERLERATVVSYAPPESILISW